MRLRNARPTLRDDERGAVQVEYTVVLVLVALVMAAALGTVAVSGLQFHRSVQRSIVSTVP